MIAGYNTGVTLEFTQVWLDCIISNNVNSFMKELINKVLNLFDTWWVIVCITVGIHFCHYKKVLMFNIKS